MSLARYALFCNLTTIALIAPKHTPDVAMLLGDLSALTILTYIAGPYCTLAKLLEFLGQAFHNRTMYNTQMTLALLHAQHPETTDSVDSLRDAASGLWSGFRSSMR